jgi:hypothetical protein
VIDGAGRFTLADDTGLSWAVASAWLRYAVAVRLVAHSEDGKDQVMLVAVVLVGGPIPIGWQVVVTGSVLTAGIAGEPKKELLSRTEG